MSSNSEADSPPPASKQPSDMASGSTSYCTLRVGAGAGPAPRPGAAGDGIATGTAACPSPSLPDSVTASTTTRMTITAPAPMMMVLAPSLETRLPNITRLNDWLNHEDASAIMPVSPTLASGNAPGGGAREGSAGGASDGSTSKVVAGGGAPGSIFTHAPRHTGARSFRRRRRLTARAGGRRPARFPGGWTACPPLARRDASFLQLFTYHFSEQPAGNFAP